MKVLQAQTTAMTQKRRVFVDFQGNRMSIDGASLKLSTDCGYHQFHFNAFGNPSKALSITCAIGSEQRVNCCRIRKRKAVCSIKRE